MGRLDRVQAALELKRSGGAQELISAASTLETLVRNLGRPSVTPDQFEERLSALSGALSELGASIKGFQQSLLTEVEKRPTGFDPVISEIRELKDSLTGLTRAIMKLEIPAPVVNVPEVDLSPLAKRLDDMYSDWSEISLELPGEVEVEKKPTEWVFDVKRNQAGFIKSIEAKAK